MGSCLQTPMERRVNRATTSIFRFDNGLTIGSLTHTILQHEMVRAFSIVKAYSNGLYLLSAGKVLIFINSKFAEMSQIGLRGKMVWCVRVEGPHGVNISIWEKEVQKVDKDNEDSTYNRL